LRRQYRWLRAAAAAGSFITRSHRLRPLYWDEGSDVYEAETFGWFPASEITAPVGMGQNEIVRSVCVAEFGLVNCYIVLQRYCRILTMLTL